MNLRSLRNFLSIAEAGSLKGAADIVNIAQPALTRQMALLEQEFGTKLFLRHHRGVMLTEAGGRLREHAERILAEVSRAHAEMSNALKRPTGMVSLGLPTAMRNVLSSALIAGYHQAFPDVQLRVHEAFVHILEDLLQSRELDVAILFGGSHKLDNFDVRPLAAEDIYLVGPPDAGLDLDRPVSIKYLAEIPIILISRRNQLRLAAEQAMARHGVGFRPFLEVEGQPLTRDLVMKGVGYTITPYCAAQADIEAGLLSGAPIRGLTITWALGVNRVRAHAPAVRELIAHIQRAVDDRVASSNWRAVRAKGHHASSAAHRAADARRRVAKAN
jgi:LysR family transcriptional regulator, nitrogen assimilation regulatory protein